MKIAFHTLGCKVNRYESEAIAGLFRKRGHEIVGEGEYADAYVINTCTVTSVADRKSRQYIRRMKKVNPDSIVAVTGCYAQTSPDEVASIPGVDVITGTNEKGRLVDEICDLHEGRLSGERICIHTAEDLDEFEELGIMQGSQERTRAYIKVQEGCDRYCSYCVIPYARGPVRSRDLEDILKEAKSLVSAGYREIVLTGINTALYGFERGGRGIEEAVAAVDALEGDFRIRLSSLEPAVVNSTYVKELLRYERLCHHLHMSAQSGSDSVLRAMNRPYDSKEYYRLVDTLYEFDECYGISTDMIVGFPGETEADFRDTCRMVSDCGFCKTHIFKYSKRPMTKAAAMSGQVSPQVKDKRAGILRDRAEEAAEKFFIENASAGRREEVLAEEYSPESGCVTGYTGNYIRTYLEVTPEEGRKLPGKLINVKLTEPYKDGMKGIVVL
ncbi:MAG: tRNA (N(6)-L-threonylcarbamoyladenosine(37)-C(2))-methylthiotransferase MtaB [Clostridiales bacterium]|nr:tRNA (N(6)-L-threonylcarbamoyladenosine(37)-C(2))-methylthiotransferase MtaB [Clostridiales bacterium]MDY2919720.1 tRNA (N(6)-L-threonylcarbamoyladenosine(37)-C(2))-methylthiotransferase MtaB [Lentihominibacter sp.]